MGCHFLFQGISWSRNRTCISYVSWIGRCFFTTEPSGKTQNLLNVNLKVCSHYTHTHTHTHFNRKNQQRKGHKEILGWVGYVYYLDSGDDIIIVHMPKLIKLYTVNIHNLLYINSASINYLRKESRKTLSKKLILRLNENISWKILTNQGHSKINKDE